MDNFYDSMLRHENGKMSRYYDDEEDRDRKDREIEEQEERINRHPLIEGGKK